jgi:hypothetical protein
LRQIVEDKGEAPSKTSVKRRKYFELLIENFEEVCEPFEYETESAITEMREFISLGKGINKA